MTGVEWVLLGLVLVCGFYAAWNIGANDVANAMGTSVGSGALTLRRAVILAAIFEFAGAFIVGSNVSETVRKKIFDPMQLTEVYGSEEAHIILACGMIASLMAAGTWLLIATWLHWPVSTTHSIVGAVVGFGCVALGIDGVEWKKVGLITAGWVVSPILSGAIAYLMFGLVLRTVFYKKDPVRAAKQVTPYLVFVVILVLSGVTTYKALKPMWGRLGLDQFDPRFMFSVALVSGAIGLIAFFVTKKILQKYFASPVGLAKSGLSSPETSRSLAKAVLHLRRIRDASEGSDRERAEAVLGDLENMQSEVLQRLPATDSEELRQVERIFVVLQILTACMVAFAHGANDVANAIGPLSAAVQAIQEGAILAESVVPTWALALGGVGIVTGLATWGWKVIRTVGKRITELTPSRGFCAEFAAAMTILIASILPIGLPVSTTHTLVGAVLGVGLARGIGSLNLKTMRDIVAGWAITIPAGAGLSVVFYFLLKAIFVDSGLASAE